MQPVKYLNHKLMYHLLALQHLVTVQTIAMEHKHNSSKSSAYPCGSPLCNPFPSLLGAAGLETSQGKTNSDQNCDSVHASGLKRPSQVQGGILHSQFGEGRRGCYQRSWAGNEKFKLFPENNEVTSPLSLREQKEQASVFFH